jgi:hypothetical protein
MNDQPIVSSTLTWSPAAMARDRRTSALSGSK